MVDIQVQPVTAEIRGGKKIDRRTKIEETIGQKYNGLPITMGGHKKFRDISQRSVATWLRCGGICSNDDRLLLLTSQ